VIWHGFLKSQNKPLLYTPITHSYSDLENINYLHGDSNWISYIHNYMIKKSILKMLNTFLITTQTIN